MRYLNRIIFINSAYINYAEINLDGNVHFIGTQGVGKSTLLRAILFFYNADTMGLGIPRQKASYTDYYFKNSNAYIIYEVVRSEGKFCVVTYKSQHRVCFRFFDGEYNRDFFVSENGNVPDSWEGIAQKLDANRVFYTKRKIDEHKEYRDILYGNHDGKKGELKKYSILESKDYQYIPKTIQNVFLNSKMDAEFIKQTIIMSLENDIRIDLNNYLHHLKDFETQITDIRKFKTQGTTLQADSISKLIIAIKHLEREKIKNAKELAWALNELEDKEPILKEKLDDEKTKESSLRDKLNNVSESFKHKENKIIGDISIFENKLKTIKNLTEEYEKKNITQIIERVSKKSSLEKENKNLLDESGVLTYQFKELSMKFQAMLDNLENQLHDFVNVKNAEKNQINYDFLNSKDLLKQSFELLISEIKDEQKKRITNAREEWEARKQDLHNLKIQKEGIKHKRFFEDEISILDKEVRSFDEIIQKCLAENENLSKQIENIQKNWELDERELQKDFLREKQKLEEQIESLNNKVDEIDSYLLNSKNSLYGWLNEQYVGWENTIGKVIDEKNVLFNSSLSPKLSEKTNSFYGIELDLNEIQKTVKTVEDYEHEKLEFKNIIEGIRRTINELIEKVEKDRENIKRRHQPKIREKKDNIKSNEYKLGMNQIKLTETKIKHNEIVLSAENEKKRVIESLNKEIENAAERELKAKEEVDRIEDELSKIVKAQRKELERKIEIENEKVNQLLISIESEIKIERDSIQKRKEEIISQKEQELSKKGADTERLSQIEARIEEVKKELIFIEENRDTVSDYKKDKRELFDKIDDFKNQKHLLERQHESELKKFNQQKEIINKDLGNVTLNIKGLIKELTFIDEDKESFENFQLTECYHLIQDCLIGLDEEYKTKKRVKNLIDEIKEIHYDKLNKRIDEIRSTITDFLGKFSDDNILKFKKQLTDTKSFLDFAEMLSDFVEENKIARIEKEVNERFALIITTIGTETTSLVSEAGKIQGVIKKINDDFVERNFAGVIKKIELKIDESKNEVVRLLILIKKFNDENSLELGEANLFSSENQEKKNKEAIDLLKQFVKKINELKRDYITLSDSFELKFRIEENANDTGWVEKLSNVGSDGTDVLVKAMVNIMLLNVFKEGASKRFKDFRLHCMMDEIGKLHPNNVRGILKFANDRNILLINSSPIENDALAFKHIYKLKKDEKDITRVNRIITQFSEE